MRRYSVVDLIRYHNLAQANPDLKPIEMIKLYNKTYPELSDEEKFNNLKKFLTGCVNNDLEYLLDNKLKYR